MSGPRVSVLTTIYNRPLRVLRNTFHQLRRNDLENTEVVIVDDGSSPSFAAVNNQIDDYLIQYDSCHRWIDLPSSAYSPEPYNINGYNNPALAWQTALDAAQGEIIVCLASDCMIQPHALALAKTPGDAIWMSMVYDMDTAQEFLGPSRLAPYGWFMSWNREKYDVNWDMEYLRGIAFEDNDFTARLALAAGRIDIDRRAVTYHQSHEQIAYSDSLVGNNINEAYTRKKWGGIPWGGGDSEPLSVRGVPNGNFYSLRVARK